MKTLVSKVIAMNAVIYHTINFTVVGENLDNALFFVKCNSGSIWDECDMTVSEDKTTAVISKKNLSSPDTTGIKYKIIGSNCKVTFVGVDYA